MNDIDERSPQERMIRQQIIDRGIRDERVLAALRAVPRDRFFPAAGRGEAYADQAAAIGHGQTISQPYIVALMTQRSTSARSTRCWRSAPAAATRRPCSARLAREVYTVERVKPLLDEAWERLMAHGRAQRPLPPRRRHARLARGGPVRPHPRSPPARRPAAAAAAEPVGRRRASPSCPSGRTTSRCSSTSAGEGDVSKSATCAPAGSSS